MQEMHFIYTHASDENWILISPDCVIYVALNFVHEMMHFYMHTHASFEKVISNLTLQVITFIVIRARTFCSVF